MTHQEAIEIVNAMKTLEATLGISFNQLGARVTFFDKSVEGKLMEAFALYNQFVEATIEERGRMIGLHTTTVEYGKTALNN